MSIDLDDLYALAINSFTHADAARMFNVMTDGASSISPLM
jgi:hypothetical protein